MKKKLLMAALLGSACLAVAGCGQKEAETEKITEAAAQTEAETAEETEAETETETAAQTETETAQETEAATEAETETETAAEAETETEAAAETETESEEETEAQTEAVSEAETDEEASSEEETGSETETGEEETETETEAVQELGERPAYEALDYVTLGAYKGLEVTVDPVAEVTEEEIDTTIEGSVTSNDLYEEVTEGTVADGDLVNIDYEGKLDGEAFDGGTAQGQDLLIGSGSFIDGFEEGLIGVEVGETVDLELTFPENYQSEELAGQDTVFTVTVNSIKVIPEMDDELANTLSGGEYTTMDAYREYIRETLQEDHAQTQETDILVDLMTQLYNTCTIEEYPQELVDYSMASMKNSYSEMAAMYGMELDDLLSSFYGITEEEFDQQMEEYIKQSLQQEMILKAIAEEEDMTISDEEYTQGCENYRQAQGYDTVEDLVADYGEEVIRTSLLIDKAMDFVRENAVVTETSETEAETAEEETAEEVTVEEVTEAETEQEAAAEEVTEAETAEEETAEEVTETETEQEVATEEATETETETETAES